MKINSTVLAYFLKRCAVSTHGVGNKSVVSMPDMLLTVDGTEMMMEGLSPAENLQVKFVETLSEEFEHFEFPIVDTVMLQNHIEAEFNNEELEVSMVGNDLIFESDMTLLNFPTVNIITTMEKFPEASDKIREAGYGRVDFETCVAIAGVNLVQALGKSGSTYKVYVFEFIVEDGKFMIRVQTDDKGGVVKKTISTVEGPDVSAKYSAGIDTVFKGMVGEVKLYFNQDTPMMAVDEDGNTVIKTKTITKRIKTIYVDCLSSEEIAISYHFNKTQLRVLEEMKKSGYAVLFGNNSLNTFLTTEQIAEIKAYIPDNLSIEREQIVRKAKSIVGKVNYFWGGKSLAIGWDNRWGKQVEVTSTGSSTTGTIRPFGLDCSGYVTWVFANMGLSAETINETIGHGVTKQWNLSSSIPESLVLPGDLAILAVPGTRKVNHIGIVVGKDKEGRILVAHCTSGANNVVISTAESVGFMYYRRPAILTE